MLTPDGATPAIAQWFAAKADHPDALVFFRMGDFYELFFDDAARAAAALDIQLTQRGTHAGRPIDMCGVPIHAADAYLARLIRKGFRVAIAEQMEDPKARKPGNKTPLKRAVTRLVTPGTLTEDTLLDPARGNLLLALVPNGSQIGAAWLDISAGRFETERLAPASLPTLLARLDPAEILAPPDLNLSDWHPRRAPDTTMHDLPAARRLLAESAPHGANIADTLSDPEALAAARALAYIRLTQAGALPSLPPPRSAGLAGQMQIDAATRASLEITQARDGGPHCLFAAIRRTLTAPGARLLADRLAAPLTDIDAIADRQLAWDWLLTAPTVLDQLRAALRQAPDIARAIGRLSLNRGTPRDLAAVRDGQAAALAAALALHARTDLPQSLRDLRRALDLDPALHDLLHAALAANPPAQLEEGGVIAAGHDGELDALRALRDNSRGALAALQHDLAQRHGVASLKIRHHQQLGYVIEVPSAAVERLRAIPGLILRQSMANAARFSDPELATLDQRITEAAAAAAARERGLFAHLVRQTLDRTEPLAAAAAALAALDVAQASARLAESGRWCRPVVTDSTEFCIQAGRHPVVEAAVAAQARFIPNDCDLSPVRRLLLLTGPNMAGKSTYLRQNALIAVLAQAGLPVPAATARFGVIDRLFCRVGASDDLARGRSTFMVEMIEAAAILTQATARSLVIIDEIGRGTATLDGLAIAWAMLEALHNQCRARTIFATHFHELARLRHELPHLCPHMMRVKEWKGDIVFLHEVAEGAGGRSWGVQVAKLAGVPAPVVRRAAGILAALESRGAGLTQDVELPLFADAQENPPAPPLLNALPVLEALAGIEPDQLSPKQALDALYHLKSLSTQQEIAPTAETDRPEPC
jgi:DNA mismatch repair protein MutS